MNVTSAIVESLGPAMLTSAALPVVRSRVLIVDDEPAVRYLFAACLSERYECVQAASVLDAFTELANAEFDLVITDVLMPGLSGVELLRRIIESYPYTSVIMVSGVNQPSRALDAIRLGAFDYLIKPCDLDVLEITVERAMQRRALLLEAKRYKVELEERVRELARQKAELERLQSQIIHNNKMASLGQLAAGVAHELNNPAGFIYGNMDILHIYLEDLKYLLSFYDEAPMSEEAREQVDEIKSQIDYSNTIEDLGSIIDDCREGSKRIKDIAQNLRVFTRLDEAEYQEIDVHEGIDSTIRLLSTHLGADNVTLVRDYGNVPLIHAYPGQLNQVWMNLLVNAAHALEGKPGQITITTKVEDDSLIVSFQDSGHGISEKVIERIFDPFFSTKAVGEGSGLGLSICFGIVERHGGNISVKSEIGHGTTFTVMIPVKSEIRSPGH